MATFTAPVVITAANPAAITCAMEIMDAGYPVTMLTEETEAGGLLTGGLGINDYVRDTARGQTRKIGEAIAALAPGRPQTPYGLVRNHRPSEARTAIQNLCLSNPLLTLRTDIEFDTSQGSVVKDPATNALKSIRLVGGDVYQSGQWVEPGYEMLVGLLAGVPSRYGRAESRETQGERIAGQSVATALVAPTARVDRVRGDRHPFRQMPPTRPDGEADCKIMDFDFRVTVSTNADRIPFPKSANYRKRNYDWLIQIANERGWTKLDSLMGTADCGDGIYTCNGLNMVGSVVWRYGRANSKADRLRIKNEICDYMLDALWAATNEPEMPAALRANMALYGLPGNENQASGQYFRIPGMSPALYVRERDRMRGRVTFTSDHILNDAIWPDPVAVGGYGLDRHVNQSFAALDTTAVEEGHPDVEVASNFQIPMRGLLPFLSVCPNIVIPVCLSTTCLAIASIRMEWTYMLLGEAAGVMIVEALRRNIPVGQVPYAPVGARLRQKGMVLA